VNLLKFSFACLSKMAQKLSGPKKTRLLWTSVPQHIREIVEKLAENQGLSLSEYLRRLIILDLDRRGVFTITNILRGEKNGG